MVSMASLGSSLFVIHRKAECPRFSFFTYGSKKIVKSSSLDVLAIGLSRPINIVEDENDHCSCSNNRLFGGFEFSKGKKLSVRRLKAAGKAIEGGDGQEIEDSFEAAVEKTKRVLSLQGDLLHKIAERRKLVSSIKSTATEPAKAKISYEDRSGTQSNMKSPSITEPAEAKISHEDRSRTQSNMNGPSASYNRTTASSTDHSTIEQNNGIFSSSYMSLTANLKQKKQPSTAGIEVDDGKREPAQAGPLKAESPNAVSPKVYNSHTSKSALSEEQPSVLSSTTEVQIVKGIKNKLPPFVSSIEARTLKDVKNESEKSKTKEVKEETADPTDKNEKPPPLAGENVMNVILVAAECAPWIKTGGLGDVAGSLPKALARRGHRVMVVVPQYGNYAEPQDTGVRRIYKVDGQDIEVTYFHAYIDGVDFVFLDCSMFRHMQNDIYGGNHMDILKRMVLFCKAAVEVPWHVPCGGVCYGDGNLVFIANDWHTALLPVYLKAHYRDNGLMKFTRSVLVIHNIAHQGRGPVDDFRYVDLPEHYMDLFKLYDPVGGDHFNIFAAALKAADRVVTVSHGYAWELKTSEGGWGLHDIINEIDWKFRGIVNGIDTKEWSPMSDIHLTSDGYTNYSLDTLQTGKAQCKEALQKELGLPVRDNVPLIGFIGRLDHQKGVDLIAEAIPWMMGQDVQLAMLGTGRQDLEQMLRQFEGQHRDKIRSWVGFSVKMAHRITAGADILLMPSRFEPCGLNQLYAMNYGTVPVVHAVGGLRDTVQQFDPFNDTGLGWTFDSAETNKLINALGYCLLTYRQHKKSWEGLQRRGMSQDLSWDNAAKNYEEVLVAAKYQW